MMIDRGALPARLLSQPHRVYDERAGDCSQASKGKRDRRLVRSSARSVAPRLVVDIIVASVAATRVYIYIYTSV